MRKTEGLTKNRAVEISRAPKATDDQAINAFLTDLRRRHGAGELKSLHIVAGDKNGNTLDYNTAR